MDHSTSPARDEPRRDSGPSRRQGFWQTQTCYVRPMSAATSGGSKAPLGQQEEESSPLDPGEAGREFAVAFVLEGARTQADHAALLTIAEALERSGAGAKVTVLYHGLGRLARLHLRSRLRRLRPELIVVTGAASLRDVRQQATVLGCPLLAYYWPDGRAYNVHDKRRPARPPAPGEDIEDDLDVDVPLPTRAVVSSAEQAAAVLRHLGSHDTRRGGQAGETRLPPERVHVLPLLPPEGLDGDARKKAERAAVLREHVALLWETRQERPHRSLRRGLVRAGVARLPDPRPAPRAVSLAYHQVLPELRGVDLNLVVSVSAMRRQIEALLRRGYEPVTVAQQVGALSGEARSQPPGSGRRSFSVSFDDGYRDTLEVAVPLLRSLGVPLTVYVITDVAAGALRLPWYELVQHALRPDGPSAAALAALREAPELRIVLPEGATGPRVLGPLLSRLKSLPGAARDAVVARLWQAVGDEVLGLPRVPRYLDAAGVKELAQQGAEIGSHTRRHPILPTLDDAALEDELVGSRRALIELCGACPGLAYPNGDSDERVQTAARAAGYDYAIAVTPQRPSTRFNLSRRMLSELSGLGLDGRFSEPVFVARALGRLG